MVQKETKPRGRPRSFEAGDALDRAAEAFWESGYAGTSLDDLAHATGLNRPSLYGAFGDKRSLYLQTLRRQGEASRAALEAALARPLPLRQSLETVFTRALDIYLAGPEGPRGCFLISTGVTQARVDEEARDILRAALEALDAAFQARFRRARDDGELPPDADLEGRARMASAALHLLAIRARAGEPRETLALYGAQAATLLA